METTGGEASVEFDLDSFEGVVFPASKCPYPFEQHQVRYPRGVASSSKRTPKRKAKEQEALRRGCRASTSCRVQRSVQPLRVHRCSSLRFCRVYLRELGTRAKKASQEPENRIAPKRNHLANQNMIRHRAVPLFFLPFLHREDPNIPSRTHGRVAR